MLDTKQKILVTGAGGFIGGHLVAHLRVRGYSNLRAVDIKPLGSWYQRFDDVENIQANLKEQAACYAACKEVAQVYNLAADMGGMWFIEKFKAECMLSVLISTNMLLAARDSGVKQFFYASSACVYNADKQRAPDVSALNEADAYPALCEDGYGWEKLFSERMARHFLEDYGLQTRVARFHNVYGPYGTYAGGREKAPAAICRKVAQAVLSGTHEIEIWGDGQQTRSFMYIDDCLQGIDRLMESSCHEPLNLGSDELVSINAMVDIVEGIAGVKLKRQHLLDAPQGVRGRNSDNALIKKELGWAPSIKLADGLARTYAWIYDQLKQPAQQQAVFQEKVETRYTAPAQSGTQPWAGKPGSLPGLGLFGNAEAAQKFLQK